MSPSNPSSGSRAAPLAWTRCARHQAHPSGPSCESRGNAAEALLAKEETPAAELRNSLPLAIFDTPIGAPEPAAAAAPIQPVMPTPQPDQPTRVECQTCRGPAQRPGCGRLDQHHRRTGGGKGYNSLVAAAMEKPAASEQAAATPLPRSRAGGHLPVSVPAHRAV